MASIIENPEVEAEVLSIKEGKIMTEMPQETRGNITEQAPKTRLLDGLSEFEQIVGAALLQKLTGSKVALERRDVNKEADRLLSPTNDFADVPGNRLNDGVESLIGSEGKIAYIDSKMKPRTGVRYIEKGVSPLEKGQAPKPQSSTIFDLKTIFKDDGKQKDKYEIIIKGDGLKKMLVDVLKPYLVHENIRWAGKDVTLTEPFIAVVHYIKELREAADGLGVGRHAVEDDRNGLKDLLRHIEILSPKQIKYREEAFMSRKVTYSGVWGIFRPGTLVVAHPFLDEPQIFCVHRHGPSKTKTNAFAVTCTAYDWNGTNLERKNYEFSINKFDDELPVRDLPCYPVELYDEGLDTLKLKLGERGRSFQEICRDNMQLKKEYKYSDTAIPGSQTIDEDSSVLDFWSELRRNQATREQLKINDTVIVDFDYYLRSQSGKLDLGDQRLLRSNPCKCFLCLSDKDKKWMESFPASDDRFSDKLWLLPPRVLGYALGTRRWAQFSVKSLVPVRTEKADMVFNDELVFPTELDDEDKKGLIKALVCNHDKRPESPDLLTDGIEGKGLGLVILLHGPPGVGKTMTAEALAKASKKPLYKVSVSDLGLNPRRIEERLRTVFELAEAWNAILLIDEADVLVDARGELGEADSNKNAIVSVMLRVLEYFSGILIMTTNRVMSLDFAIVSRINFAINFGELDTTQQKQIWLNWHKKLSSRNCENTTEVKKWIEALLKRKQPSLNGREIRNVFTTAQTLAVENNNKITTDHLEKVINSMAAFQGEMSKKLERARGQSTALKSR